MNYYLINARVGNTLKPFFFKENSVVEGTKEVDDGSKKNWKSLCWVFILAKENLLSPNESRVGKNIPK